MGSLGADGNPVSKKRFIAFFSMKHMAMIYGTAEVSSSTFSNQLFVLNERLH